MGTLSSVDVDAFADLCMLTYRVNYLIDYCEKNDKRYEYATNEMPMKSIYWKEYEDSKKQLQPLREQFGISAKARDSRSIKLKQKTKASDGTTKEKGTSGKEDEFGFDA